MKISSAILFAITTVSISLAQSISISGKVTDTGSTPLPGAAVKLETLGLTATTGTDGSFTLIGIAGISGKSKQSLPQQMSATVHNAVLSVNMIEKSPVEIIAYSLQGKMLSIIQKVFDAGIYSIALPAAGTGVIIYKVKIGKNEFVIKNAGVSKCTAESIQAPSSNRLAKQAMSAAAINDVIAVTKTGYLNYRVVVYNSDTNGIEIKMIVCAGTVTDTDGNVYQTVRIGNQVWMAENLRVTKYNDGSAIPLVTNSAAWQQIYESNQKDTSFASPAYCFYKNTTNADSIKKYGVLYNWYIVNTKKLAPAGWHVPTDSELEVMQSYLVMHGYNYDGTTDTSNNEIAMALASQTDWYSYTGAGFPGNNLTKNNASGFSALPGGCRNFDGMFDSQNWYGYWWSATESNASHAYHRYLSCGYNYFGRLDNYKGCGFSVRLVKD